MSDGISSEQLDFTGRRVLVTGAAGGIGSAMSRAFAAHGADLVLADSDQAGLDSLAQSLDRRSACHVYDQADNASVVELAQNVGRVDVLLNNAGIVVRGPLLDHDPATIARIVLTNLVGPIVLAREIAGQMIERRRGVIVNTASQLAFSGAATRVAYAASKAGVVQFTRSAAAEWAPYGVRVVALAPGMTLTPMSASLLANDERREAAIAHIPCARFGDAAEMGRFAVLLASDLADYLVGETLVADGGYVVAD